MFTHISLHHNIFIHEYIVFLSYSSPILHPILLVTLILFIFYSPFYFHIIFCELIILIKFSWEHGEGVTYRSMTTYLELHHWRKYLSFLQQHLTSYKPSINKWLILLRAGPLVTVNILLIYREHWGWRVPPYLGTVTYLSILGDRPALMRFFSFLSKYLSLLFLSKQ